jgi:beta-lactam-binding protein with PASTA domain
MQRSVATEETVYEETVPVEAPPPRIWPWLVVLLILVAGGLAALYILTRDNGDAQPGTTTTSSAASARVDVPDVVGERADRAAAQLVDAGLKAQFQRRLSKKASGMVLEQDPGPATTVPRNSSVLLTISRGADTVQVPALTGLTLAEALSKLQAVGLKGTAKRVDSDRPAGQVVAQEPGGGRELKRGSGVVLTIAKGRQQVVVPDVVGQSQSAATTALEQAGLKAGVLEVPGAGPKGTVVAQSPRAAEKAPKGSTVQINVSKGVATTTTTTTTATTTTPATPVTVPDVVGNTQAAAKQRLENAGFKVDAKQVLSTEPKGTVVAQFPAAGQTAKRGASIRINVSAGDGRKAVPDVTGDDEATARQRLENAGFTVNVVDQDTTDPTEDGIVVDQDPAGGDRRKPGAEITIVVGVLTS